MVSSSYGQLVHSLTSFIVQVKSEVSQPTSDAKQTNPEQTSSGTFVSSGDPEKDKKIRNINKVACVDIILYK